MRNDGPAGYMPAPGAVSHLCGAEGRLFTARPQASTEGAGHAA